MQHVSQRSFHLHVSADGEAPDSRLEASPGQRPQCIQVGDARPRQSLPPSEVDLLRDAPDGRRDLRHQHAPGILERRATPHEEHRTTSRRLREVDPPDLELPRKSDLVDGAHAARLPEPRLLRALTGARAWRASALCSSQPSRSLATTSSLTGARRYASRVARSSATSIARRIASRMNSARLRSRVGATRSRSRALRSSISTSIRFISLSIWCRRGARKQERLRRHRDRRRRRDTTSGKGTADCIPPARQGTRYRRRRCRSPCCYSRPQSQRHRLRR